MKDHDEEEYDLSISVSGDEEERDLDNSPYKEDIRKQAIECMGAFFLDKKYWAGGKIPKSKLYTEENILTVMQTNVMDALEVAYICLEEQAPQSCNTNVEAWDMDMCYGVLLECPNRFIPKCCAGGILLVYLALCQGVDYIETLKEYDPKLYGSYHRSI